MMEILTQYRVATTQAMDLTFKCINPRSANYSQKIKLGTILNLTDFVPDSFDTPQTRAIRAQVPQ